MKNFYLLCIAALLFPVLTLAQVNYKPSYIVSLKGDTVKGYIDYRDWNKNPKSITFKSDLAASAQTYTVNDILAFNITGKEFYKKFTVKVSMDNIDVSNIKFHIDITFTIEPVFLRRTVTGKNVSLYTFTDKIKTRYYIADGQSEPIELVYRKFIALQNNEVNNSPIITQAIFRKQLQKLAVIYNFNDLELTNQIQQATYTESDLIKIANKINGEKNSQTAATGTRYGYRFFAGISLTNVATKLNYPTYNGNGDMSNSQFPELHFGLDILFNKNVSTLIARAEINFTKSSSTLSDPTTQGTSTYSFTQYIAQFNPQLLYNFYNTDAKKFYVGAGPFITAANFVNATYTYTTNTGVVQPTLSSHNSIGIGYGLMTKLGYIINNKLDIYVGYSPMSSVTPVLEFGNSAVFTARFVQNSAYKLGVNFLFGK